MESLKILNVHLMISMLKGAQVILKQFFCDIVQGNVPSCLSYKSEDLIVLNGTDPTVLGNYNIGALRMALLTMCSVIQNVPVEKLNILEKPVYHLYSNSPTVSYVTIWDAWKFPELHNLGRDSIFGVDTGCWQSGREGFGNVFCRGILTPMHCLDLYLCCGLLSSNISYIHTNQTYISSLLSHKLVTSAADLYDLYMYATNKGVQTHKYQFLRSKLDIIRDGTLKAGDILIRYNPKNTQKAYKDEGGSMGIVLGCTERSLQDPNKGVLTLGYFIPENTGLEKGLVRGYGLLWNPSPLYNPNALPAGEEYYFLRPKNVKIENLSS